jgi:hypothetical protein
MSLFLNTSTVDSLSHNIHIGLISCLVTTKAACRVVKVAWGCSDDSDLVWSSLPFGQSLFIIPKLIALEAFDV